MKRKFLIINPFGIGDVLFTTPVISAIKQAYPKSIIGYWCNQRVQEVLRNNKKIDRIFALSRGDLKKIFKKSTIKGAKALFGLLLAIRREKFDISLDFSLEHRYSLISKILGVKQRIGFNYKGRGRFLTQKIDLTGYSGKHVVEYYLGLLKPLNIGSVPEGLDLSVSQEAQAKIDALLGDYTRGRHSKFIGIAPGGGASWGKDASFKHWPAQNFAQLADRISVELQAKMLVLGDDSDKEICAQVEKYSRTGLINLAGSTTLEEFAALINRLQLLVTNDGGPLHMAAALGVKTVSIFGPVDETVYGPYPANGRHLVIKNPLDCRPCYKEFRFPGCFRDKACLEGISVDEVFQAVKKLSQEG